VNVRRTDEFAAWIDALRDLRGRARIQARISRLLLGNPGDVRPVGHGVLGVAHRLRTWLPRLLRSAEKGKELTILLAGGDKSTQVADIRLAQRLAEHL